MRFETDKLIQKTSKERKYAKVLFYRKYNNIVREKNQPITRIFLIVFFCHMSFAQLFSPLFDILPKTFFFFRLTTFLSK